MDVYGIIGFPLGHSFSQRYFTEKFERAGIVQARYDRFPLADIAAFPALLAGQPELRGLNVTIPYKVAVLSYLDALDETARAVGAVNTIRIRAGHLKGYNTDVIGFERSLQAWLTGMGRLPAQPGAMKALILGTGGASKAVAWVLEKMDIAYAFVSRWPAGGNQLGYPDLPGLLAGYALIVNTTPLGTYPAVENCPEVPFQQIDERHLVYDLVYNPAETLLLQRAKTRGAAIKNGLEMLQLQAEAAWDIWQQP